MNNQMRTKVCDIQKIDEDSWEIITADGNSVDVINTGDVRLACDDVNCGEPCYEWSIADNLADVWDELYDNFRIEYVNPTTLAYREFVAWVNYISAKCIGEIIAEYYKEQLLNVE